MQDENRDREFQVVEYEKECTVWGPITANKHETPVAMRRKQIMVLRNLVFVQYAGDANKWLLFLHRHAREQDRVTYYPVALYEGNKKSARYARHGLVKGAPEVWN